MTADHGAAAFDLDAILPARQRDLLACALRITGDLFLAEDALQEACLQAHAARASFRGDADPVTWLYRILIREAIRLRRRRDRLRERHDIEVRHAAESRTHRVTPPPEWYEEVARLLAALDTLPEAQRLALALLSVREFPATEAAAILGTTPATIYTRAFRARQRLRELLSPESSMHR
ncbi:MAG: RNA polymerase sigma factor [Phycisphaeraceae bacterium]|nr:RNA polymerase sigma factor [Phycisphaeraceae bacterium]